MTANLSDADRAFWTRFQLATGETARPRGVDAFGDSPEMMDELLALVLSRTKQATASLARWYVDDPEGLPTGGKKAGKVPETA